MADNNKDEGGDVVVNVDSSPAAERRRSKSVSEKSNSDLSTRKRRGSRGSLASSREQHARFSPSVQVHEAEDADEPAESDSTQDEGAPKEPVRKSDADLNYPSHLFYDPTSEYDDEQYRLKRILSAARITKSNAEEIGLCIRLVTTLQTYYMPTFITYQYAQELMKALNIQHQGSFNLQPNGVWASFGTVTRYLPTSTIYNLRNLEDVEQLVQDIVSGDMEDLEEADRMLDAIDIRQGSYPFWVQIIAFALMGFCTCITFYEGQWVEAGWAAFFSSIAGAFNEYLKRQGSLHPHLVKLTEFMVPCITGVVVSILFLYVDQGYCHISIAMATVLWWLPGFSITFGCAEMLNNNVLTGSARMAYGLLIGQLLAFGLYAGASFVNMLNPGANTWLQVTKCDALVSGDDPWYMHLAYELLFYPVIFISELIIFNCHWRQWFAPSVILFTTRLVIFGLTLGLGFSGTATTGIGTAVMVVAIFFMRFVSKEASPTVLMLPTIFLMLPGSYTVRNAFAMFFGGNYMGESQTTFSTQITLIGLSTSIGLLCGAAMSSLLFKLFAFFSMCVPTIKSKLRKRGRGSMGSQGSHGGASAAGSFRRGSPPPQMISPGFNLLTRLVRPTTEMARQPSADAVSAASENVASSLTMQSNTSDNHLTIAETPPTYRKSGGGRKQVMPDIKLTEPERRESEKRQSGAAAAPAPPDATDVTDTLQSPVLDPLRVPGKRLERQRAQTGPHSVHGSSTSALYGRASTQSLEEEFPMHSMAARSPYDSPNRSAEATPTALSPAQSLRDVTAESYMQTRRPSLRERTGAPTYPHRSGAGGAGEMESWALHPSATSPAVVTPTHGPQPPKQQSLWAFDFDPPLKHQAKEKKKQHHKPPSEQPGTPSSIGRAMAAMGGLVSPVVKAASHSTLQGVGTAAGPGAGTDPSHPGPATAPKASTGRFTVSTAAAADASQGGPGPQQGGVAAPPRAMKASNSGGNLAASDLHDIREHDEPSYTLPSEYTFSTTASSSPRAPRSRAPTASGGPPSVAATPRKRGTTVNALDLATALETIDTYTRQTGGGYDGSRTLPRMPRTSQGGGAGGGGGAADLVSLFQPMGPEQPASQQGVQGGRSRAASQGPALANPASKKLKQPFIPI